MFKVLVVDDEPMALTHIVSVIEKKCPDYEVIMTAENGQEALDKIRENQPDLVISDVKMPLLNGIELVTILKKKYPDIFAIIVSGYQDFEYAKGAIQSGVYDYILKPIVPSSMKKTMDQLAEKMKSIFYQKRNEMIQCICNGTDCAGEKVKKYFYHQHYYTAIIRKNGLPRRFFIGNGLEVYSDIHELMTIYGRDEMEALYIIPKELLFGKTAEEYILGIQDREKQKNRYITTVYGSQCFAVQDLAERVKELYRVLDTVSAVGVTQTFDIDKATTKKEIKFDYTSIHYVLENMEALLREKQIDKLIMELKRLYHIWAKEKKPQLWLEHMSRQIFYLVRKHNQEPSPLIECEYMMEDAFYYAASIDELLENLLEIMFKYMKEPGIQMKVDSPEYFNGIKRYLYQHIAENITLQGICKQFCVSQTYLSRLFRKYENKSFSQFLTAIRMQKAMELMQENNAIFMKDVAEMTGYNDQFYFSRIFRSYTGKSPSDYLREIPISDMNF